MPTINIETTNFGYKQYRNRTMAANTTVDFHGSTFLTQQLPTAKNLYPIQVQGKRDCKIMNARVLGTNSRDGRWMERYNYGKNNSAAFSFIGTDGAVISRMRAHDVWDAARASGTAEVEWTLEHSHFTHVRDDAIEADGPRRREVLIDDCLIDGCYVGISATSGGDKPSSVTLRNTLMRLEPMFGAHTDKPGLQPGHKWATKIRQGDTVNLIGFILRVDQLANSAAKYCAIPMDGWKIGRVEDSAVLWLGKGDYPYDLDKRMDVVKGEKARDEWDRRKRRWFLDHPDVPRFDFDPSYEADPPADPRYAIVAAPDEDMDVDAKLSGYGEAKPLIIKTPQASLDARVLWSDAGLHFGLRVVDGDVRASTETEAIWRDDSIEIFVDPTGDGGATMTGGDFQVVVSPQGRLWTSLRTDADAAVKHAAALNAAGYVVEVLVPWPAEFNRDKCRISFVLNDNKDSLSLAGETSHFRVPDSWKEAHCVKA